MDKLQIGGRQKFLGKEIPVVLGGFGHNKRCISDKTIAEIHGMREPDVRRRITDNIKRFNENIDFIDMKSCASDAQQFLPQLCYTPMQISKAEHIYILSERGYAKLIKIMDSDLAWEIHDKLVDEYFVMREQLCEKLDSYMIEDRAARARRWAEEWEEKQLLAQENKLLLGESLKWADRSFINAAVRQYAGCACNGDFSKAWGEFKREILYKHGINLNSRITKRLNESGKKTKPKTLDMLDDSEISNAVSTIVAMCREKGVDIGVLIKNISANTYA